MFVFLFPKYALILAITFALSPCSLGTSQGRTTLVIAHRLGTIKNAGMIYVIEDGLVSESGTDASLRKAKGAYAGMLGKA